MAEKTDRELLELAAKAAGMKIHAKNQAERDELIDPSTAGLWIVNGQTSWNPLADDGDALRLAVKLHLEIDHNHKLDNDMWVMASPNGLMAGPSVEIEDEADRYAATRRAIVRAAAAVGEGM